MKIVRCLADGAARYGQLCGRTIRELAVSPFEDGFDKHAPVYTGKEYQIDGIKLLTPCQPTKIMGVGVNYVKVAEELQVPVPTYPITFMKPTGTAIPTGETIRLPVFEGYDYLYEGEMGVVIGKEAYHVSREEALSYVLGCTCMNDITDRTKMNVDALKLKCVDTFAPFGPCIDTEVDPLHARVRSWVNGELRQDGTTADMLFNAAYIIELFTSYMTLYPGDVISMGTPPGAGAVHPGDVIGVEVDDIGLLENPAIGI